MNRTQFTISWLYGEFRIARFQRGKIESQWASDQLVESHAELLAALAQASEHVDLSGKADVTVVHEHDLHTHDYLEVPAMKRRDLEKYLQRRVEQDKSFDEEAKWCFHTVKHGEGQEGVLLHLLPKRIVDSTVAATTSVGLAPKMYVPLTEIVSDYLPTANLPLEEMVVVVACFKTRVELIVALGDGEALFVRELNYGFSEEELDRPVTDLNRTIRYARQQLGRNVAQVLVMGEIEDSLIEQLSQYIEVPVRREEGTEDPFFWAEWATRLSGKLSANFISVFAQKNISQDVVKRIGAWATAAVIAITAITTLISGGLVAHREEQIKQIGFRADEVRMLIAQVEEKVAFARRKQDHLGRLRATTNNLPSLVMVHLSRLTPDQVVLTNVDIARVGSDWALNLRGRVSGDMREAARVLATFEGDLAARPWNLQVQRSFTDTWMQQFEQGKLRESGAAGFEIQGVLP